MGCWAERHVVVAMRTAINRRMKPGRRDPWTEENELSIGQLSRKKDIQRYHEGAGGRVKVVVRRRAPNSHRKLRGWGPSECTGETRVVPFGTELPDPIATQNQRAGLSYAAPVGAEIR